MSTIEKSIATTISMIVLVLSLAVISPTTAIGKGNKRTGNPTRFQQGLNLKTRNVSPSSERLRSDASRTSSFLHGDFSSFRRRVTPGFIDASQVYGSDELKRRNVGPTGTSLRSTPSRTRSLLRTRRLNPGLLGIGGGEIFF